MTAAPDRRRSMLAKVHIAAKELGLDEAAYGDVLRRVTGENSARNLSLAKLDELLGEFKRLGWQGRAPRPPSLKPYVRLVYALWLDLQPFLRVGDQDTSKDALRAFVRRQTRTPSTPDGVSAPEFLDAKAANLVVEGLKAWLARARREAAEAAHAG